MAPVVPPCLHVQVPPRNRRVTTGGSVLTAPAFGTISTYSHRVPRTPSPPSQHHRSQPPPSTASSVMEELTSEFESEAPCGSWLADQPYLETSPSPSSGTTPSTAGEDVLAHVAYARIIGLGPHHFVPKAQTQHGTAPASSHKSSPAPFTWQKPSLYQHPPHPSLQNTPTSTSLPPAPSTLPIDSTFGLSTENAFRPIRSSSKRLPIPSFESPHNSSSSTVELCRPAPAARRIGDGVLRVEDFQLPSPRPKVVDVRDPDSSRKVPIFTRPISTTIEFEVDEEDKPASTRASSKDKGAKAAPTTRTDRRTPSWSKVAPWESVVPLSEVRKVGVEEKSAVKMKARSSLRRRLIVLGGILGVLALVLMVDLVVVNTKVFS